MIRIIAKFFAVTFALTFLVEIAPVSAATVNFIANGGSGLACSSSAPCATIADALAVVDAGGQITCFDSTAFSSGGSSYALSVAIDCPGVYSMSGGGFTFLGNNQVVKIRNMTMRRLTGTNPAISVQGSGTLIIENCIIESVSAEALDIEPTGAFNLVVTNSRMSNNSAGVLIAPQSGGSVTATFNNVTIANNSGGGIKTESTNGAVTVDVVDSVISDNGGNGLNAVGGAGGANMLNLIRDVIASNGSAGVQANGTNAAALVNNTVLDSNTAGATSVVGGGRILTYGNNSIVGTSGSGFTGPTPLQ
jgi:Right handed beta helix region